MFKLFLNFLKFLILLFLILPVSGCVNVDGGASYKPEVYETQKTPAPKVSTFLSLKTLKEPKVSIQLSNLEIFNGVEWVVLMEQPIWVESEQISKSQALLARSLVPPGTYTKVRYKIFNAIFHDENKNVILDPEQAEPFDLNPPLSLNNNDSVSIFMNWDVNSSKNLASKKFTPFINISVQEIPLMSELAFVSCPDINTVYIFRTDTNRVIGSWGIKGGPAQLAVFKDKNEMYVLVPEIQAIKVIELSSGVVKDSIRIPMSIDPFFMAIDPDGVFAYILDRAMSLYKIDLETGTLVNNLKLEDNPDYMEYLSDQKRLAIASEKAQKVFLVDSSTLQTIDTISVSSNPKGIMAYQNNLYIAESRSNSVMFYDLNTSNIQRIRVGSSPNNFIAHDDYIYVSNADSGTLSVLVPGQLASLKEIHTGGMPMNMALSDSRNWLYVNDARGRSVAVIDLTVHRLNGSIDLKARPMDIKVIR